MYNEPPAAHSGTEVSVRDTLDDVVAKATAHAIAELTELKDGGQPLPSPAVAATQLVNATNSLVGELKDLQKEAAKSGDDEGKKVVFGPLGALRQILPRQAAALAMVFREIALVQAVESQDDRDTAFLAVYDPDEGIYRECSGRTTPLTVFLREMAFTADDRWIAEALSALRDLAPLRYQTSDADLVALDDCVYNRVTGDRADYDPAEHVFLAKVRTRLPESEPELPRIQNPDGTWWDPQSWLEETVGAELAPVMHEVNAYLLCPRAFSDDKIVAYLSESGSNGKGTTLVLQRAIVGGPRGVACASLGLEKFDGKKDFMLTRLMGAVANLSDESDPDAFLSSSAQLKAISSHDPVQINRKNRDPIEVRLFVPMIFSLNRLPKIRDKSAAVDRRLHIIRFGQKFEGSAKNSAIKKDYLLRDEVREWFVWQALVAIGPITELSTPPAVADALEEYRGGNDHVVAFWRKYEPELTASNLPMLPLEFLYDAYVAESRASRGSGAAVESEQVFKTRLVEEATRSGVWQDERDSRGDRRKLSLKGWAECGHSEAATEIFGHLGLATVQKKTFGYETVHEEVVVGDRRLARWTRRVLPSYTKLATTGLPARGHALTRDAETISAAAAVEPSDVAGTAVEPAGMSVPEEKRPTPARQIDLSGILLPEHGGSSADPFAIDPRAFGPGIAIPEDAAADDTGAVTR